MKIQLTTAALKQSSLQAFSAAAVTVTLLMMSFFMLEPQIGHGQAASEDFIVRQTILAETSFLVGPPDVTMSGGGISGITGGNATGSSRFVVKSNNASGYYVEIDFFDNAGAYAMRGDEDGGAQIKDYGPGGTSEPEYNFVASTAAQFAYTLNSSTTLDTDDSFLNNGSNTCNSGSTQTYGKCWKAPSTTGFRVVDRGTAATTGATSTLYFKVNVPSGATPTPTAQTYTATATLSVFVQ